MKMFLLRVLIGVFAFQGLVILVSYYKCNHIEQCHSLGHRTEQLFAIATATVLSLLSKEP